MPTKPETPAALEAETPAITLEPGFHVMLEGISLGRYPTAADAEAFADAHPRANGLTATVTEVKA